VREVVDGQYIGGLDFTTGNCADKSYARLPTSLEFGTGSDKHIYVCVLGDDSPPYLTNLAVVTGSLGKVSCPAGTTQSMDLNAGTSTGKTVYACMTYTNATRAMVLIKDILAVIGINQLCPDKYDKLPGNLNDGVIGENVLACHGMVAALHTGTAYIWTLMMVQAHKE
jgi:hypothetical protein